MVAAFAIGGIGAAYAQNAVEQLQPLVETTARRLMIGEQVAPAKWDSGEAHSLADAEPAHRDLNARKTTGKPLLLP